MSLLIDALRRAEEAKRAAGEAASAEAGAAAPGEPLSLEPLAGAKAPAAGKGTGTPMTRDQLPNISQSLEILTEDFPLPRSTVAQRPSAQSEPARERTPQRRAKDQAAKLSKEQSAARQLFDAKGTSYNPHKPFYITLGLLGIASLGIGAYFWYQLQPPRATQTPVAAKEITKVVASAETGVSSPYQTKTQAPVVSGPDLQWTPSAKSLASSTPSSAIAAPSKNEAGMPTAAPARTSSPEPRTDGDVRSIRAASRNIVSTAPADTQAGVNLVRAPQPTMTTLERAYTAFERGDFTAARADYESVLAREALNRDALLGLAAIHMRTQHYASAESLYLKVLEVDPHNAHAQAGLMSLRANTDPVGSESRVKTLIAQQPDAVFLNFLLGNQYAAQARWAEAQQAYFQAYASNPNNADYAFNLAVSLDHLRQKQLALKYYREALALANNHPAAFNAGQVQARVVELAQ